MMAAKGGASISEDGREGRIFDAAHRRKEEWAGRSPVGPSPIRCHEKGGILESRVATICQRVRMLLVQAMKSEETVLCEESEQNFFPGRLCLKRKVASLPSIPPPPSRDPPPPGRPHFSPSSDTTNNASWASAQISPE